MPLYFKKLAQHPAHFSSRVKKYFQEASCVSKWTCLMIGCLIGEATTTLKMILNLLYHLTIPTNCVFSAQFHKVHLIVLKNVSLQL